MLINLRNALMAGKRLPYDAEVEYLESSGTQWINTGYYPNNNTKLQYRCFSASNGTACGCMNGIGWKPSFSLVFYTGVSPRWGTDTNTSYTPFTWANVDITVEQDKDCYLNGQLVRSYTDTQFQMQYPLIVFDRSELNNNHDPYEGKVYYLKIFENGTLVRDYIPVRKGTVGYLYDRVSGKLFGNQGTGDFVLGPDVVPVEYIESHGAEYIDTGMYPTNNATTIVDAQLTRVSVAGATCHIHIVDSKESWNSRARTIGYWSGGSGSTSRIAVAYGSAGPAPASYAAATDYTTARMIYKIARNVFSVGSIYAHTFAAETFTSGLSMKVLANAAVSVSATAAKLYGWQHYEGDVLLQHCVPIHVGTEGAMMDVLTRRVYRNAGTGAFTYGNDLKYPIPAE